MQQPTQKIGLLFGSFNPIHVGHLILASYFLEFTDVAELQVVLSPQNPLKHPRDLAPEYHRLEMSRIAIAEIDLPISICELELTMPKPSYTIDTLKRLNELYPQKEFVVLMGADSLSSIERWKSYHELLASYQLYVYPRLGYNAEELCSSYGATYVPAPLVEVSSTFIRNAIQNGRNVNAFMPQGVAQYINKYKLYIN